MEERKKLLNQYLMLKTYEDEKTERLAVKKPQSALAGKNNLTLDPLSRKSQEESLQAQIANSIK